ncbi:DUF167 domain-containing protein [Candidatus Hodarchaeum mangrovi]
MQNLPWIKKDGNDLLVNIQVKTHHFSNEIEINQDFMIIKIKAAPIKGKANKEIIKLLRRQFKTDITLESGLKRSNKVIRFKNISFDEFMLKISTFFPESISRNRSK